MSRALREACRVDIDLGAGNLQTIFSLPALARETGIALDRLPAALRVVLESLLRNCDGRTVTERHVLELAQWRPAAQREAEIPFTVGRVVLNCAAGIPLLGDLTALRGAVARRGGSPAAVEPRVPVDMALDHTLTVDHHGSPQALEQNMRLEIERNRERFAFVNWAMQAYRGIRLMPPGFGILHQINLEHFAPGLLMRDGVAFPDTLVGTDSHTGMIAALGTVGWGVGGIEAQAALLGEPIYLLTPDVVGVHLTGELPAGATSTDLVLHITELLRRAQVVGKFVEFFGAGVAALAVPDRATIANMAPEYGATIGFFPVDDATLRYLAQTGRAAAMIDATARYYREQGLLGTIAPHRIDYSSVLTLELGAIEPCVAGPKRPQDRIALARIKPRFAALLGEAVTHGGYGRTAGPAPTGSRTGRPRDGDIVIAAITSCTNTSNPGVMLAAGMLARKAVGRGLAVPPWVKTTLAPGSRVVSRYLEATGLQRALDTLGFMVTGYSCTTCFGASGPLDQSLEQAIADDDIVACAVLSGNRNFEARIHPSVRAAFLASPPLVVAFALAGRIDIDFATEPLGTDRAGQPVHLRDIWPSQQETRAMMDTAFDPDGYRAVYGMDHHLANPLWDTIPQGTGPLFQWDAGSTYIVEPPFLAPGLTESGLREFRAARALAVLGDSITTDHISPIGSIPAAAPAGLYLQQLGVEPRDFNNYGARRMNHEVMVRGTFASLRLRNLMVPGSEGGVTVHAPGGERTTIYEAAMRYARAQVPLFVFAGAEYGTGSARDWAAKGTRLLGVRAVIAGSFERIHRSNLVGMGVLPCQLPAGVTPAGLRLTGRESFDLAGLDSDAAPRQPLTLTIHRQDGTTQTVPLILRLDTPAEIDYVRSGGIMPHILKELLRDS